MRSLIGYALVLSLLPVACTPARSSKGPLNPADAEAVAILAVRTAERDRKLELEPFDTQRTPKGEYTVSLQRKTTRTTADHWRVLVRPDRSAEVTRPELAPPAADTLRAYPDPLRGDRREILSPDPVRVFPTD